MQNAEKIYQLIRKLNPESEISLEDFKTFMEDNYGYTDSDINGLNNDSMTGLVRDVLQNRKLLAILDWKYYVSDIFYSLGLMLETEFLFDESARKTTFNGKEYKDEDYEPNGQNFDQILQEINEVIRKDHQKELVLLSSMGDYYEVLLKPTDVELTEEEKKLLEH